MGFWNSSKIESAIKSTPVARGGQDYFNEISIDSRTISKGDLFIAIKGENFDGHDYMDKAVENGALGIVVNQENQNRAAAFKDIFVFVVDDTTKALGKLALFKRDALDLTVIGITGSAGKTSTREILKTILSIDHKVLSPEKNFNNHIGVPLTLLNAQEDHEFAIIEMGMNSKGEIEYLSKIAKPHISIITKIAPAHIEAFNNIDEIACEKASIALGMQKGSTIIINDEDQCLEKYLKNYKILKFGEKTDSDLKISDKKITEKESFAVFELNTSTERLKADIKLEIPAETTIKNSASAFAASAMLGIDSHTIKSGIIKYKGVKGRFFKTYLPEKRVTLIDDTYNSNPESLRASIKDFKNLIKASRGFIVLGDMLELGKNSDIYHLEAGRLAAEAKPEGIFAYGSFSNFIVQGAADAACGETFIFSGTHNEISDELIKRLLPEDLILIKGSRGAKMENILESLTKKAGVE